MLELWVAQPLMNLLMWGGVTQTTDKPHALNSVDRFSLTHCDLSGAQTQVRTRFGRLVWPVNTLIQNYVQAGCCSD